MLGMWDIGDVGCWGCGMFSMWDVGDVGCSGCGMFGMWDVRDVGCSECGMFGIWDVREVGCSGGGMFGRWDVQDVGCLRCGMWDVGCWFTKCRPPNGDTTLFEKHMKRFLSKNEATKKEVILIGDININLLDFDKNKRVQSFVNLMFRFGMIPTINKPTPRVTRHTATAIDHVFTNTIMDNIEVKNAIVKTDISDHFPIIFATKKK